MMAEITNKKLIKEAKCALARKDFYEYQRIIRPKVFLPHRWHLKDWSSRLQNFVENSDKTFFMLNGPPRHGKTVNAVDLATWIIGKNPKLRVLALAYCEDAASDFTKDARDIIMQEPGETDDDITFADIFPDVKIKRGDAQAFKFKVTGASQITFFAASLNSAIMGKGFDIVIIDDMIKDPLTARNSKQLDEMYFKFRNTVVSRLEKKCKVICVMHRWATKDICGRMMEEPSFRDRMEILTCPAKQNGKWIAEDMMAEGGAFLDTLDTDIFMANYMQEPLDITDRLYSDGFKTWNKEDLPTKDKQGRKIVFETEVMVDSADRGKDYLCALFYIYYKGKIFITDIIYTQKPIKETQQMILDGLIRNNTASFICEGNAGGSIFTENIKKLYNDKKMNRCRFSFYQQNKNKESRIRAQSFWVQDNIYMPEFWDKDYLEFYKDIMSFQGNVLANAHDDCADCLTAIADKYNGSLKKGLRIVR